PLPSGITLTPAGTFSGMARQHGTFRFAVHVVDCSPASTCSEGTTQQSIDATLTWRVSATEQQSFGLPGGPSFQFGGSTGLRVAQVFTVGAQGVLTAIRLNQLACPAGATVRVGIERVTNGAPDGNEMAAGTGFGTLISLDTPLPVAIDQQLAFVVSAPVVCQMRNLPTADNYNGGDAFIV